MNFRKQVQQISTHKVIQTDYHKEKENVKKKKEKKKKNKKERIKAIRKPKKKEQCYN